MNAASSQAPGLVSFIGAGPGDPELLTIKAGKAIASADAIIYAGSLVSPQVLDYAKPGAILYNSARLTLEQIHARMRQHALQGASVARLHTGDPSLYGALAEQTALLDADGIPWRVIPGITAAMAAAAAAKVSFTLPETAQSLCITRLEGRTPMPPNENLAALASHQINMAIYLAGNDAKRLQQELLRIMPPQTPVICASRASWPDETIVHTTLAQLAASVKDHTPGKQTVFLILPHTTAKAKSKLYDKAFTHSHRKGNEHG